jgi:hypothetical protein
VTDRPLISKTVNALLGDGNYDAAPWSGADAPRGVWVGGRLTVTDHNLEFKPNAMNKVAHAALGIPVDKVLIRLSDVLAVRVVPAPITKIVEITSPTLTFRARCFGAKSLAAQIEAATFR